MNEETFQGRGNTHRPASERTWRTVGQEEQPGKRVKIMRGPYANFRSLHFLLHTTETPEGKMMIYL